jgi:hypothetical protein
MIKAPFRIPQMYRAAQVSALPTLGPAQRAVVELPLGQSKMRVEGGGVSRDDSLTFWGFFPVVTLAALVIWEFGLRAAWVSCVGHVRYHRKATLLNT